MSDAALPVPMALPPPAVQPPGGAQPPAGGTSVRPRVGGLDPATFRQTAIVAAILASAFFGSQVLNEALPAAQDDIVVDGTPIAIGGAATITPLAGWSATTHEGGEGIRLEKGVVVLDLFAEAFGQTASELADGYLEQVLRPAATQLTASDQEVASGPDGTAARFTYQGIFQGAAGAIEGEVTALKSGTQGVVADAWSSQGKLGDLLDEVRQMVLTIEVQR